MRIKDSDNTLKSKGKCNKENDGKGNNDNKREIS